jgi:hypothetical protein
MALMRQLTITRGMPGDPTFSTAINLVPIEFGRSDRVMTAWENFREAANRANVTPNHTNELVKCMLLDLGYSDRAASQISRGEYFANALSNQQELQQGVLKGLVDIATASKISAAANVTMVEHKTQKPLILPADQSATARNPPTT